MSTVKNVAFHMENSFERKKRQEIRRSRPLIIALKVFCKLKSTN